MRILIVSHAPLSQELGAGQMALNLGEALRLWGHEVIVWSPHITGNVWQRRWPPLALERSALNSFLAEQETFDVIDVPSALVTKKVCRSPFVVARSVQPDILYLLQELRHAKLSSLGEIARAAFACARCAYLLTLIMIGWRRCQLILCLGTLERRWMERWLPFWRGKIEHYVNALNDVDREKVASVRKKRQCYREDHYRFLWIGRWAAHKGVERLFEFIKRRVVSNPKDTITIAGHRISIEHEFSNALLEAGTVRLVPSFRREELPRLLAEHNAGLFTSNVEGWGLVLNEMLESGMTVFSTNVGGVRDLQPFFQSQLLRFPPMGSAPLQVPSGFDLSREYLRRFCWRDIAERYVTLINGYSDD